MTPFTDNQLSTLDALDEALSWLLRTGTAQQYTDLRYFYKDLCKEWRTQNEKTS